MWAWAKEIVGEANQTLKTISNKVESALDSHVPEMKSNLSEADQKAAEQSTALPKLGDMLSEVGVHNSNNNSQQGSTDQGTKNAMPYWDDIPASWVGRESDWAQLCFLLIEDVNTFLVAPSRVAASGKGIGAIDTTWTDATLSPEMVSQCLVAVKLCNPLHVRRFELVPRATSDTLFWSNLFWRLRELGKANSSQCKLLEVLQMLNTEPTPTPEGAPRKKNIGVGNNGATIEGIVKKVETWIRHRAKSETLCEGAKEDMRSARDNVRLLSTLNDRSDVELRESIFQSCRYQKQKLASRISDLSNCVTEGRAMVALPEVPSQGIESFFAALEDVIAELHAVNTSLMDLLRTETTRVVPVNANSDEPSPLTKPLATTTESNSVPELQQPGGATSPSTTQGNTNNHEKGVGGKPVTGDDFFSEKLPWEEDGK
eukprot:PhF_6_TR13692/c0_g1_i1/m.22072